MKTENTMKCAFIVDESLISFSDFSAKKVFMSQFLIGQRRVNIDITLVSTQPPRLLTTRDFGGFFMSVLWAYSIPEDWMEHLIWK